MSHKIAQFKVHLSEGSKHGFPKQNLLYKYSKCCHITVIFNPFSLSDIHTVYLKNQLY